MENFECKHEHHRNCEDMCKPNHRHEKFDRVVATWQTVRHFDVKTHDTVKPVCTDGMNNENLEKCVDHKCCHSRHC